MDGRIVAFEVAMGGPSNEILFLRSEVGASVGRRVQGLGAEGERMKFQLGRMRKEYQEQMGLGIGI